MYFHNPFPGKLLVDAKRGLYFKDTRLFGESEDRGAAGPGRWAADRDGRRGNGSLCAPSLTSPLSPLPFSSWAANELSLFLLPQAEGVCHRELPDPDAELSQFQLQVPLEEAHWPR